MEDHHLGKGALAKSPEAAEISCPPANYNFRELHPRDRWSPVPSRSKASCVFTSQYRFFTAWILIGSGG